ncbi:MAG TPA: phosphatase PAP2 family protein [Candidatus Onthovivens sp.]|nr:phosphatase PAP2 family protein [Candidatus Onthovivens sp.]
MVLQVLANSWINPLDQSIFEFFASRFHEQSEFLKTFWITFSSLGNFAIIWLLLIISLIVFKRTRKAGFFALIVLIISVVLGELVIKNIAMRNRPFIDNNLDPFGFAIDGYSFLSSHTYQAFSVSTSLLFYYLFIDKLETKPLLIISIIFIIIAFFIGLSRLALIHHYFTDVLAGLILGVITPLSLYKAFDYTYQKITIKLARKKD